MESSGVLHSIFWLRYLCCFGDGVSDSDTMGRESGLGGQHLGGINGYEYETCSIIFGP